MKSKQTHTVEDLEKLLYEFIEMFKNAHTKEEKKVINTKRKNIERLLDTMREKHTNGKKYPMKKEPKDIPKKELLALIDSVETPILEPFEKHVYEMPGPNGLDFSGVFTSDDRTTEFPRTSILDLYNIK